METKLALVTEEYNGEIISFDTPEEAEGFARGFSWAGGHYGAGHCAAYNLAEAKDNLLQAREDFKSSPDSKYYAAELKNWEEIVSDLSNDK